MSLLVAAVHVRAILDSRGCPTLEADVELACGATGRASCPLAIAAGRRERRFAPLAGLDDRHARVARAAATGALAGKRFSDQESFDASLDALTSARVLRPDAALALSLAFVRAAASSAGRPLHRHVAALAGTDPALPRALVNVFSGGVHAGQPARSFQQVMYVPERGDVVDDVAAALAVFAAAERSAGPARLSASSGLLCDDVDAPETLLGRVLEATVAAGLPAGTASLGVDVAAEHLWDGERYRLGPRRLSGRELLARLERLAADFPIVYLEDPFDARDTTLWAELSTLVGGRVLIAGDDLFATSARRVDPALAGAVVLKPSQAGTVTATIAAAHAARVRAMDVCVSHRSGETEDPAVCDLAVGLGARYLKLGGPRRGDRLAKYNQLLRLAEDPAVAPAAPPTYDLAEVP